MFSQSYFSTDIKGYCDLSHVSLKQLLDMSTIFTSLKLLSDMSTIFTSLKLLSDMSSIFAFLKQLLDTSILEETLISIFRQIKALFLSTHLSLLQEIPTLLCWYVFVTTCAGKSSIADSTINLF